MNSMTITSAQYLTDPFTSATDKDIEAVIDGETLTVPVDPANRHYAAIKAKHDDADDSFTIQDAD